MNKSVKENIKFLNKKTLNLIKGKGGDGVSTTSQFMEKGYLDSLYWEY